jgi:phosphomannomutase/phosphoglucomutase
MNLSIFREYDIRGVFPDDLSDEALEKIAHGIAVKCHQENVDTLAIGRDGRLSGPYIQEKFIQYLNSKGINTINIGLVTSPLLYFAAKKISSKSGVMITGSHNPKNHNGFKTVINDKPVAGEELKQLINLKFENKRIGSNVSNHSFIENYIDEVIAKVKADFSILKVVIDSGNGAAGAVAPKLFNALGCEVIELFSEVDGNFPNHHPDPGKIDNLKDLIDCLINEKADIGLAFDGDGDRLGVVDNLGNPIFPDKLMMLFAEHILKQQKGDIIFDVKCTNNLANIITENGGNPIMSPTGHFHIKNKLKETKALLAGEMSGHIFFNDTWYGFDDGHYSGVRLLEILANSKIPLSEIIDAYPKTHSTPELNINVEESDKFHIINDFKESAVFEDGLINTIDGLRVDFRDGWGLLRASNTTPKLVLRFEAISQARLDEIKDNFLAQLSIVRPNLELNLS